MWNFIRKTDLYKTDMAFVDFNSKVKLTIWPGIVGSFHHTDSITFGHIQLDKGTPLPEHSHPHEQWTHVIKGKLKLTIEGESQILEPGMSAYIPSDKKHSGQALTHCYVIDCFSPVREDIRDMEENI